MSASKLIHLAAFGFQASSPPDLTLNPTNKRIDQSVSDFQTGIGPAVHATLDTKQLIFYTKLLLLIPLPLY